MTHHCGLEIHRLRREDLIELDQSRREALLEAVLRRRLECLEIGLYAVRLRILCESILTGFAQQSQDAVRFGFSLDLGQHALFRDPEGIEYVERGPGVLLIDGAAHDRAVVDGIDARLAEVANA